MDCAGGARLRVPDAGDAPGPGEMEARGPRAHPEDRGCRRRPRRGDLCDRRPHSPGRLVEVYHPRKRRWRTAAPLPEPVHHPGAVVAGKRLFVVGGFGRGPFWAGVDTLYEYLPRPDAWKRRAPMPSARGALGVAVIDGKLHAVGGRNQRGDVAAHEVYDAAKRDRRGGLGRPDFRLRRRVGGGDLRGQRGLRPRPGPVDKVRPDALGAAAWGGQVFALSGGPTPGGSYSGANESFAPRGSRSVH